MTDPGQTEVNNPVETINNSPQKESVLKELGLHSLFEKIQHFDSEESTADITKLIPLKVDNETGLRLQILELTPKNPEKPLVTGIILFKTAGETQKPVGHLVFNQDREEKTKSVADVNHIKTKDFVSIRENLPQHLKDAINQSGVLKALEINSEFRGKKLGEALWYLGTAYLQNKGVQEVEIVGDITIGKVDPLSSFYQNLGAEVKKDGRQIFSTDKVFGLKDRIKSYLVA